MLRICHIRGVFSAAAVCLCLIPSTYAQHFVVTGLATDSTGIALARATVMVLAHADSALVQFATSREDGTFTVGQLTNGLYVLRVSHVGAQTELRGFEVKGADVDMGTIVLHPQTQELQEFVVTDERLPYVVRGDTIEYNALAFLMQPQDMVEDLLRRLPGIDVDRSGAITAHGEFVKNVLVEGKEFFSSDYTIATRNLPSDAVDKVQVYDKPSDKAELTGVPDGQDEKTINLALTEESKRGAFGQTTGGFGTIPWGQGRYFGRASVFRFAPLTQLALIGNADNVNQPGFSVNQLRGFGGAGSITRPGDGISESLGTGFNVSREVGDNSTINVSYFLTDHTNSREAATLRKELLGSAATGFGNESSNHRNGVLTHSAFLKTEIGLGTGHDLRIEGTLSRTASSVGITSLKNNSDLLGMPLNATAVLSSKSENGMEGNARVIWRKRISASGRSVVVSGTLDARDADLATNLNTKSQFYGLGDLSTRDEVHQEQELQSSRFMHGQRLELVQPLSSGRTLSAYLHHTATDRRQEKMYFDIHDGRRVLDIGLSEEFGQHYEYFRSGTDFTLQAEDRSWWALSEIEAQHSRRRGSVGGLGQSIRSRFTHMLVLVMVKSDLGDNSEITVGYETSTREPSLRQLQPFTDNSNPLRIYIGNPALIPEYQHELSVRYSLLTNYSKASLSADISMFYTRNSIIYERTVDTLLRQTLRPVNAESAWSMDGSLSIGMPIRSLGMEWKLRNFIDLERATEFINGKENVSRVLRYRPRLDIDYFRGEVFDITSRGSITYNSSAFH